MMAGVAATVLGAPAAYANVTCEPGNCVITGTSTLAPKASFSVTPSNVDASYRGSISANLGNTITSKGAFTDTFNFLLPTNGVGGGSVTTVAAKFHGPTDLDFTSVLINGAAATISKSVNGIVEIASGAGIMLSAGANTILVSGISRGNGSYGGSIAFTPSVPETATWGMMILGFVGMGAAMRYRRKSTNVAFA
ncbi:FxDxF family PEP-CTERM protein [Sphingomonas sp. GC_Shp_3]|uniref:FxDxF family PEP-CTERM protein n=1 Tax=Sphingomonas sp. GC_Shp_3 TaxID=2937383 RepID=UPI00226A864F|nr:FxDxF family PEP-CTERM protein [Sphingomonas sp. GC_Shp_3]